MCFIVIFSLVNRFQHHLSHPGRLIIQLQNGLLGAVATVFVYVFALNDWEAQPPLTKIGYFTSFRTRILTQNLSMNSEIILYQNADGSIKIDVRLENETVWLTQDQMATLFGKAKSKINEHIKNVFEEGELDEKVAVRKFRITTRHGAISGKTQEVEVNGYNLAVIISVGCRVKAPQGTQFRIWATHPLKEYFMSGFRLNENRFKSNTSIHHFNELQSHIFHTPHTFFSVPG